MRKLVKTSTTNYAFGMLMPNRKTSSSAYKFGFNGQEKDDEISNIEGANTTAMYWEYDNRLGRRWEVDPVTKSYESPYDAFGNNPILVTDPAGDDSMKCSDEKAWQWKIEKGDTYEGISKRTGVSVDQLRKWNNYMDDYKLQIGSSFYLCDDPDKVDNDPNTPAPFVSVQDMVNNVQEMVNINITYRQASLDPLNTDNRLGASLILDYKGNENCIWFQTFETNDIADWAPYNKFIHRPLLIDLCDGNDGTGGSRGPYSTTPNIFSDIPSRLHPTTSGVIQWYGMESLLRKTTDGWVKVATFRYSWSVFPNGKVELYPIEFNPELNQDDPLVIAHQQELSVVSQFEF